MEHQPATQHLPEGLELFNALGGQRLFQTVPFLLDTSIDNDALVLHFPLWKVAVRQNKHPQHLDADIYRLHGSGGDQLTSRMQKIPFHDLPLMILRL